MAGIAGEAPPRSPAAAPGRRRAAGIYGAIITAAIIAAAGGKLPTTALAVSVLVTLLVYWIAEEYAEVLGEQVTGGELPTRASVRAALTSTWPMVSASYLPLLALLVARVAGASASVAANVGLVVAILLLIYHGWSAGRAARLRGWKLAGAVLTAAALGLVMVLLKDLVLIHLHLGQQENSAGTLGWTIASRFRFSESHPLPDRCGRG
jgi:hypothetical protein